MTKHITLSLPKLRELDEKEIKKYEKWGYKYVTCGKTKCEWGIEEIIIPKGFLTDGSTSSPDVGHSWLIHDYLYAKHEFRDGDKCKRRTADRIMYDILAYEGRWAYKWVYWATTVMFAKKFNAAWERSGKRGPQFLKDPEEENIENDSNDDSLEDISLE